MKNITAKDINTASEELGKKVGEEVVPLQKKIDSNLFQNGVKPKHLIGMNQTMIEGVYGQAYRLYNTGKYNDAVHIFRYLIMLDATEPKYLMGLAACFHMLKEYDNATELYSLCSNLDPRNPIPYYHSTDCYMQMKDYRSALIAANAAIERAQKMEQYATIANRLKQTQETLKRLIEEEKEVVNDN
jgi:type III secretion system low calcium response chaperone LcrH/SycD